MQTTGETIPLLTAYDILFQLFSVLLVMHIFNYYHLDLKPENIVFTDVNHTQIALIDFENTIKKEDDRCNDYFGTKGYMSPGKVKFMNNSLTTTYSCKENDLYALYVIITFIFRTLNETTSHEPLNKHLNTLNILLYESLSWKTIIKWFRDPIIETNPTLNKLPSYSAFNDSISVFNIPPTKQGGYLRNTRRRKQSRRRKH
jgi:serine/threonine protein kinase